MSVERWWNTDWQGKIEVLSERLPPPPLVIFSITLFTWTTLQLNPGLRGEKRATIRLNRNQK
jgi:hypothetical protein